MTRFKSSFAVPSGFAFTARVQNATHASKKPKIAGKVGATSSSAKPDSGATEPFLQNEAA